MHREQSAQRRRARLLLALDEHRHADRRLPAVRPKRCQMRCDARLVVGAPATVQAAVTLGRLERRRRPLAVVALRLHVVMGIQQHRRRSRRSRVPGDDGRRTAFADDPHVAESRLPTTALPPPRHCAALRHGGRGRPTPTRCAPGPPGRARTDGSTVTHSLHEIAHRMRLAGHSSSSCAHTAGSGNAKATDTRQYGDRRVRSARGPSSAVNAPRGSRPPRRCRPRASATGGSSRPSGARRSHR